jgi:UDP-N-acetylglucosamine 2-epimerase (non-hydrolysing)
MRPNTERPVTISHGTNRLVTPGSLLEQFREVRSLDPRESWPVPPLWDGRAGERIADVIADFVGRRG